MSWITAAAVALLLVAHVSLALYSTAQRSVTTDETYHITGGFFYDQFGDYRIHPENGVLPQRLHGLAAVMSGAKPPQLEGNGYWRSSDLDAMGYQLFYESGNDHWSILLGARTLNLLFSAGICVLAFGWARSVAGNVAGFVTLGLAAFSPTLLAHGPLATSDAAAAFMLTASTGAFWWQLRSGRWGHAVLSAAVFGLACVSKYSAVLLIPIFLILIAMHVLQQERGGRKARPIIGRVALHAAVAWVIIWAFYGFRFSAFAPDLPRADHFVQPWDWMLSRVGWQRPMITWLRDLQLLPEAFLFGYTHVNVAKMARAAFLAGDYSVHGWRSFFPLAFGWKSTPAELICLAVALALAAVRMRQARVALRWSAPLAALILVYGVVAIFSALNIGHRHLLPLYPAFFILAGVAVARLPWPRVAAAAAIGAQISASLLIAPFYLAYFNAFAGGPANGWRLLVDSSLDWGQDLPGLAEWLRRHNAGPEPQRVFLAYFGTAKPAAYGVEATRMVAAGSSPLLLPWYQPAGGIYAISATMLQEVYSPVRGGWTTELEREYQELRKYEDYFRVWQQEPQRREELDALVPAAQWVRAWQRFELLRYTRLCAYLRARGPDEFIGYSILIFRLTDAEVNAVLRGPYSELQTAIENAVARRAR